ncbi:MAG: DUF1080 domain-containing protein [Opitutaceae bacterium]|nr:DUF1080 domain-containing protein [Opitutaceae bacterium]
MLTLFPLRCALVSAALVSSLLAKEWTKEETEQHEPVPPVVSCPEGGFPADALVLFDGKDPSEWVPVRPDSPPWTVIDGALVVNPAGSHLRTRREFRDIQLHLEFRTPSPASGSGQQRGNSGVFLMGLYELQILDSYQNSTYVNGQAGAVYKQAPPLVNAARPPGLWQSLDILFLAPRFAPDGKLLSPARITVLHNGVLVQHDFAIRGTTVNKGLPVYEPHADRLPIVLQNHKNPVAFRRIWVREIQVPRDAFGSTP